MPKAPRALAAPEPEWTPPAELDEEDEVEIAAEADEGDEDQPRQTEQRSMTKANETVVAAAAAAVVVAATRPKRPSPPALKPPEKTTRTQTQNPAKKRCRLNGPDRDWR